MFRIEKNEEGAWWKPSSVLKIIFKTVRETACQNTQQKWFFNLQGKKVFRY